MSLFNSRDEVSMVVCKEVDKIMNKGVPSEKAQTYHDAIDMFADKKTNAQKQVKRAVVNLVRKGQKFQTAVDAEKEFKMQMIEATKKQTE